MRRSIRPWVVKLGGSLHDSPYLRSWLKVVAAATAPVVIVPGGGPFADTVRVAQKRLRFSDSAAHGMALLAMDQYGLAMIDLIGGLQPAATLKSIAACLRSGGAAIWLPTATALGQSDIAENWDVTSDSLALWLAHRLRARGLLLVKAARLPNGPRSAAELAHRGIIDAAFPRMLASRDLPCWCIGARRHREAGRVFRSGGDPKATSISRK